MQNIRFIAHDVGFFLILPGFIDDDLGTLMRIAEAMPPLTMLAIDRSRTVINRRGEDGSDDAILGEACAAGAFHVAQFIARYFRRLSGSAAVARSCGAGEFEIARWVIGTFGDPDPATVTAALKAACASKRLRECAELFGEERMTTITAKNTREVLKSAIDSGVAVQVQWLVDRKSLSMGTQELVRACMTGNLEFVKFIDSLVPPSARTRVLRASSNMFQRVCEAGFLDVLRYVAENWVVSPDCVRTVGDGDLNSFGLACYGGHLATAQWVLERFFAGAPSEDVRAVDAFQASLWDGHTDVAEWLVRTFGFDKTTALPALKRCYPHGSLRSVQWLCDRFFVNAQDVRENELVFNGVAHPNPEKLAWLIDRFGLTKKDVLAKDGAAFSNLVLSKTVMMLCERFQFTANEIRAEELLVKLCGNGSLRSIKWLLGHFPDALPRDCSQLLERASGSGSLDLLKFLSSMFPGSLSTLAVARGSLFAACRGGHKVIVRWLVESCIKPTREQAVELLVFSFSSESHDLSRWIVERFCLTESDAEHALEQVCDEALRKKERSYIMSACFKK